MKRRLFIAINLPENVKKNVFNGVTQLESFFLDKKVRFLDEKNLHITLVFLGYQEDTALSGILSAMKGVVKEFNAPKVELNSDFAYVPEKNPRMIWLRGSKNTSENLSKIKDFLEEKLIDNKIHFKVENRIFNTHITICRFANFMRGDLPELSFNLGKDLVFEAATLDLMESHLSKSGAEYELLQSMDFKLNLN